MFGAKGSESGTARQKTRGRTIEGSYLGTVADLSKENEFSARGWSFGHVDTLRLSPHLLVER